MIEFCMILFSFVLFGELYFFLDIIVYICIKVFIVDIIDIDIIYIVF